MLSKNIICPKISILKNIEFPVIISSSENTSWKKEFGIISFINGVEQNFLLFKNIFLSNFLLKNFTHRNVTKIVLQ